MEKLYIAYIVSAALFQIVHRRYLEVSYCGGEEGKGSMGGSKRRTYDYNIQ